MLTRPLIAILLLLSGTVFSQSPPQDQSVVLAEPAVQLVNSMIDRLLLCREVAWSKFCSHVKVRDLAREARVLADLKDEGRRIGLAADETDVFFKPQIVASCRYQEELIARWGSGLARPSTPPKDLQGEIRPLLDKVDRGLLWQWKTLSSKSFDRTDLHAAERIMEGRGIPADVVKIAVRPLSAETTR